MRAVYVDCSTFIPGDLMDDDRSILPQIDINVGDPDWYPSKQLISERQASLTATPTWTARSSTVLHCEQLFSLNWMSSYIDVSAAEELGIRVRIIRSYGDRTIAEHAFTLGFRLRLAGLRHGSRHQGRKMGSVSGHRT